MRTSDGRSPRRRIQGMTRRLFAAVAVAFGAAALSTAPAYSSCMPVGTAEQRARAGVILDGIAIEGPTATGVQRFRVTRYLKGVGPRVVRVSTGNVKRADGTGSVTSISVAAKRGELWRIFAQGTATNVLRTSLCAGSRKR